MLSKAGGKLEKARGKHRLHPTNYIMATHLQQARAADLHIERSAYHTIPVQRFVALLENCRWLAAFDGREKVNAQIGR